MTDKLERTNQAQQLPQLVEHLFRAESARLIASLASNFGLNQIDLVEDVVQETLLRALKSWPTHGVPDNPTGWLFRTAQNMAIDHLRREALVQRKEADVIRQVEEEQRLEMSDPKFVVEISDAQLRMLFACCHPLQSVDTQVALALKELCGFSVNEIARAFLVENATIAQRIVRGKKLFRSGQIPFAMPEPSELPARIDALLRVIYLIFNEGYNRHSGDDLISGDVSREAIRLGELLAVNPITDQPTLHALLALFYFQISRFTTRTDSMGELILMEDQDRSKWDREAIASGLMHLEQAASGDKLSRYHLEAGIASLHVAAESFSKTNWALIVEMYDQLVEIDASPVVELNRAVAMAYWKGPEAGLALLEQSSHKEALQVYHLYHAVRGELLCRLQRHAEAADSLLQAIEFAGNETERKFLSRKLADLTDQLQ